MTGWYPMDGHTPGDGDLDRDGIYIDVRQEGKTASLPKPSDMPADDETRPPIPGSCARRPTVGGLVAPFVNIRLADGGVDFRTPHQGRFERCWRERLCQTCGTPYGPIAVLFGGPRQLDTATFDEPPLCPACALYASKACPMVAGRMPAYADRARVSEGTRGHVCPDPGCDCGGFVATDPNAYDASGEPAHEWFAVWVRAGAWELVGHEVTRACSDRGCDHTRVVIGGCQLTAVPLRVVLVSAPGRGRVWEKIPRPE